MLVRNSGLVVVGAVLISPIVFGDNARAQTQLPGIVVTTPSPIISRPATANAEQALATGPVSETPLPGTLPIVTDQFATVTVVPKEEIRRNGAGTLGDLLFSKPGITGSSFAPGASSRPIIRGLDVNRVGIVNNGIGGGGVSDLGEDHFVPIDPLTTNQIEVIRGPATLRYGSQSIGGVVSASDNRIPEAIPQRGFSAEFRGNATTVNNGLDGAILLDAGAGNFAFHADAYGRRDDNYSIPRSPYRFDPARPFDGKQPNSALRSDGASLGGSYIFNQGFVGVAFSQANSLYRIPGIDGEDHNTRIDAHQTKVTSKGEYRPQSSGIDAIRFWAGATDYKHNEIGLDDGGNDGVRQTFTNKEQEGRVEVQLMPFDLRFAALTTAVGVQVGHQELTAPSPDDPGSPLNGLYDPNKNTRIAGYIFNEFKFSDTLKSQVAGRIERVNLAGSTPDFPSDSFTSAVVPAGTPRDLTFTPKSASFGVIQNFAWDLVGSVTAQYVERAPKPAELFSRGAHDATATFDIGNPNLGIEVAKTIEIGLRRAKGPFRFEATAYYTRFDGFIFRRLTGVMCSGQSCGQVGDDELNQARYSQRDAIFRGGEFQFQYDVAPLWGGLWGVEGQADVVRATFTDGSYVPRIPPVRVGGGAFWRDDHWLVRVNLLHAFSHTDIAANETTTGGYNLLKAELSYTKKFKDAEAGPREITVGISGDNLLNDDIRNSVSFTKDEVLMPSRSVRFFANTRF